MKQLILSKKCTKKAWCERMKLALSMEEKVRGLGLITQTIVDMTNGRTIGHCVVYTMGVKRPNLVLRACPWCAESIVFKEESKTKADKILKRERQKALSHGINQGL